MVYYSKLCCRKGKYDFAEKDVTVKDDDFTVENEYYEPRAPSPAAGILI